MKISIITPSFNQGKFIEDAIQSVIGQDYANFEHIIVDGASTDDTVRRLKKYPHIKWISEPDEGQSDALNKGFRMATGDVIGWLNCDDFYLPGAFHKAVESLKDERIDGVYSNLGFCDVNKNILKYYKSNKPSKILSLFHTYITSETLFFKRKIIDNKITVEKELYSCMDQEFVARVLYNNYHLKYVNKSFAVFRWQGQNKSLDTPQLRKIRLAEGIKIFNKYNGFVYLKPDKKVNIILYNILRDLLKPYRLFLKMTS
jgi:glycosyltransferase involved in cell wall biosynthesis